MTKHSRIIEEMHETVQGLHSGGLIDERRMREFEALYRANQVPKFNTVPENITVNADDAECGTDVTWDEPTFEDNCAPLFQIIKNTTHQPEDW